METKVAKYYLKYMENSDAACTSTVRFFAKKESARAAMRKDFEGQNKILGFPPAIEPGHEESYEKYTYMSEDSISVLMGIDSFNWEIGEIVPED